MRQVTVQHLLDLHISDSDWRYMHVHTDGKIYSDHPHHVDDAEIIGWWEVVDGNVNYDITKQPKVG